MRFAIWTAVSSKPQAKGWGSDKPDDLDTKDSLPEQEKRCRAMGSARGWREYRVYVVPGESRTRWVNLRDAENEIPALHQMLEDAKSGLFDILVLYDYNRLRDLLDPVAKTLASYGVQLYSVNQPVEPLPAEQFNPYASDSESMMRGMSQVISRWQINDLRRKHSYGIMGRVRKGLHPAGRAPFGYTLKDKQLVVDHAQAAVVLEIKDMYLAGQSVPQIIEYMTSHNVRPPRGRGWSDYGVRYILTNPVYSGTVRSGYFRKINDPRTGKSRQVKGDPARILSNSGKHQTLWDENTRQAILDEMKRRTRVHKGNKTYRLSNLLRCDEHDRTLRVKYLRSIRDDAHRVWYCPGVKNHWHVFVHDSVLLAELPERLKGDLAAIQNHIELPREPDNLDVLVTARDALLERLEHLTDALELGALDAPTFARRKEALDRQVADAQEKLLHYMNRFERDRQRGDNLQEIVRLISDAPDFITQAPAQTVNAELRALIEKVTVIDGDFEIHYR